MAKEWWEEPGVTVTWFYLSFADPDLPEGSQFLGGCYVRASDHLLAVGNSHALGINPGGQVEIIGPIPIARMDEYVKPENRERLLTAEEING